MKRILTLLLLALALHYTATAQKTRTITGEIKSNITLFSDTLYKLSGYVYVKNNATITIQPGTIIQGSSSSKGTLIITRNGRINAQGSASMPIVFTSEKAAGTRAPGDWGGIVILGKATINRNDCSTCPGAGVAASEAGGQNAIEGDLDNISGDGLYGGTDDGHSSGTLSYVRIEFGGIVISPGNEINGLTMGGVGSGTQINHVQVSLVNDDAFEWFGGTVNATHLISYRNVDDDFDTDFGYRGKVQFGIALRDSTLFDIGSGPTTNGFESDNDGQGTEAKPYTTPVFSNMTLVGPLARGKALNYTNSFQNGARIRRNSGLSFFNSIIIGFPTGVFIDGGRSAQKLANDTLIFKNNIISGYTIKPINAASGDQSNVISKIMGSGTGNDTIRSASGILADPFNYSNPDFSANSTGAKSGASFNGIKINDAFFTSTTFRGAMGADDWTSCWARFNPQSEDYSSGPINYIGAISDFSFNPTSGTGYQFTNNSTAGTSYFWDFGVSNATNDTSSQVNPMFIFPATGTYTVTLTAKSPCGDSVLTKVIDVTSGIKNPTANLGVNVYPNPTRNLLNVGIDLYTSEALSISIYTMAGQEVKSFDSRLMNAGSQTLDLNVTELNPGMYLLRLQTSQGQRTVRFTIAR